MDYKINDVCDNDGFGLYESPPADMSSLESDHEHLPDIVQEINPRGDQFDIVTDRNTTYIYLEDNVVEELNTPSRRRQIDDFGTERSTDKKKQKVSIPPPQYLYDRVQINNIGESNVIEFPVAIAFRGNDLYTKVCIGPTVLIL